MHRLSRLASLPRCFWILPVALVLACLPSVASAQSLMTGSGLPGSVFGLGGPGDNEASRATLGRIAAEQDQAAADQREKLASPEAQQERENSKTAHDDLTDAAAVSLLKQEFAGELRPPVPDAETLIGSDRVTGFLSDYVARIEGLDGRPDRLIDSQVPLRTADGQTAIKTPVDLDLVREGDSYSADNGPVDVELGGGARPRGPARAGARHPGRRR